jgi:uncharacterized membrane protein YdfJ with MMPL/SSD domain
MNSTPDLDTPGPARRLFWVAGLAAMVALALAPLSFHVERRLDTAVRLEGSESDYVARRLATRFRSPFVDHEVFLVARVLEARRGRLSKTEAITEGLARTAGLITSAAAIIIVVFAGFTLGEFLVIKMLGFTLAVAVLLNATLVRIVIGPALLSLAGDWNWWPGGLAGANARAARERIR